MHAYIFPGQGSQFEGMGKDLYETSPIAKAMFDEADAILGWSISDIMFNGSAEDLTQTKVTQPAVFLNSIIRTRILGNDFKPEAVAGHSLGEFTALVAAGALSFADGLRLVAQRAMAMQKACEKVDSTMAAVLALPDEIIEKICAETALETGEIVVPANYNTPGQLVISGSRVGILAAEPKLKAAGAKRVLVLAVGGAFHSPLMQPAQDELEAAIEATEFSTPNCPIIQNFDGKSHTSPTIIRKNLISQLTAPVLWAQSVERMVAMGVAHFTEISGPKSVLKGMVLKIAPTVLADSI
jgi:[acyl-carrier-protein] S-malonyltransferase